jgi:hypothetical protein
MKEANTLEEHVKNVSIILNRLSSEIIERIDEEVIVKIAFENPQKPGVYGFLLAPECFDSLDHLAEIQKALLDRLGRIENMEEKIKDSYGYGEIGFSAEENTPLKDDKNDDVGYIQIGGMSGKQ